MTCKLLLAGLVLLGIGNTQALQVKPNALDSNAVFGIQFEGSDLAWYGSGNSVVAVSMQEYQAGPFLVTEVSMDLNGGVTQLRLYHTERMSETELESRAKGALDKATDGATSDMKVPQPVRRYGDKVAERINKTQPDYERVIKDYPVTTHAHTIEYKVAHKEEHKAFFTAFSPVYTGEMKLPGSDKPAGLGKMVFVIQKGEEE